MGISDPVLWSFAQLKKNPSAVIDAIIFFLSKHNLTLGVERLYRFIDERTFRQKHLVSVTMAVKKTGGFSLAASLVYSRVPNCARCHSENLDQIN